MGSAWWLGCSSSGSWHIVGRLVALRASNGHLANRRGYLLHSVSDLNLRFVRQPQGLVLADDLLPPVREKLHQRRHPVSVRLLGHDGSPTSVGAGVWY